MQLDSQLILLGSQTNGVVTPVLVTALGQNKAPTAGFNVLDLASLVTGGNQAIDEAPGYELLFQISVNQALTSGGAATVRFQLLNADDLNLSVNLQVINQTDDIPIINFTTPQNVPLHWDRAAPYKPRRYVGISILVGTAALTNASPQFFASVVAGFQDLNIFANSGYAIL